MLWFTAALVILVVGIFTINFSVSREVLDQSIQERLMDIVDTNVQEIEFYNSSKNEVEEHDFFLSYKGGILEIDDDFCAYLDGISTALIDSENNLLYGSMPILLEESEAFSFTSVGTVTQNGQRYYIYERKLSGENLEGLWLRGVVSENETINMISNMVRLSLWLVPLLAFVILFVGYIITKRSFLPIEKIDQAVEEITASGDLSKRVDVEIEGGKDEIHRLAVTFNSMFDRLEKSFNTERQFTSDASHELRTPVSVIKAHCEYALKYAQTPEELRESLQVIERQADRATDLLTQLLFFTRLHQSDHPVRLEKTNLSDLVEFICEDLTILLASGKSMETDIEPGIFVLADKSLMTRLISNLIDNAYKYSGDDALVKVSLHRSGAAGEGAETGGILQSSAGTSESPASSLPSEKQYVRLSVEDNGIGISPENIEKIWARFYQEDPSRTETASNSFGLGLSMVKEIADIHGGKLEVESVPGKGSRFTLVLPCI